MKWIQLILFCGLLHNIQAQKVLVFTNNCEKAYTQLTALNIAEGKKWLHAAKAENPNNALPYFIENYLDFFQLFLNEEKSDYTSFKKNFDVRLKLIEQTSEKNPLHLYCKSVLYLHKAAIEIKFGEKINAAFSFRKAFLAIKQNQENHPDFQPNYLIYGPLKIAVGTVPKGYQWLTGLFGMKGSIKEGRSLMNQFFATDSYWHKLLLNEALFYNAYLMFYIENKKEEVFEMLHQYHADVVNNHLLAYMMANLSLNHKKTTTALHIIQNRNPSSQYIQTPIWDFELGYAYLYQLNLEKAIYHFNLFLKNFHGRFYVKDVYQKLAWCYYLRGDMQNAYKTMQQVLVKGATDSDADKKAWKDAKAGVWPNKLLLMARLYNDGGYHQEALQTLSGKTTNYFTSVADQLEFTYRIARIYDDLNKSDEAISFYKKAIQIGKNRSEYYASRAALQIGLIFEKKKDYANAIFYYQTCIDMEDHEYEDTLEQRAKSGIERCKRN